MTQPQFTAILQHLLLGGTITHKEARQRFKVKKLGVALKAIQRRGYALDSKLENDGWEHYDRYWIKPESLPVLPPAFKDQPVVEPTQTNQPPLL